MKPGFVFFALRAWLGRWHRIRRRARRRAAAQYRLERGLRARGMSPTEAKRTALEHFR